MIREIILVGAGGAVGSILRYLFALAVNGDGARPVATLIVNVGGCFVIGCVAGLAQRFEWIPEYRLLLAAGFCGGFTTFSAFALENLRFLEQKDYVSVMTYVFLSVTLSIGATFAGLVISRG